MFTSISRLDKPFRCHIITLSPSRSQASLTCNNICNSMGKDTPEYRPLQGEEVETQTSSYIHYATNNIPPWGKFYFTFLHLLVAALVVTILFGPKNCSTYESKSSHGATWSPIRDHVEYKISGENGFGHHYSNYSGHPNPEGDRAWDNLVQHTVFRATREELEQSGETIDETVELSDDGGGHYLASLSVYHEIHCLRRLRFHLYRNHYYPNLTEAQEKYLHEHLDHCIEILRLTVMCYGNPSLLTFTWNGAQSDKEPATKSSAKAVCVDWTSMERWGRARQSTEHIHDLRPSGMENHEVK